VDAIFNEKRLPVGTEGVNSFNCQIIESASDRIGLVTASTATAPISTTTAAASATAAAAATASAATAAAVAAASAATATAFTGTGFVDCQRSALELSSVQGTDRCFTTIRHFDKAKAAGSAGFAI
jgi:hypothetical protein